MNIDMISTSNEEVSDWLNRGKDVLIEKLVRDGVLTQDQGEKIMREYLLTLQKNHRLSTSIRKFLGVDDNNSTIICSKL